MSYKLGTSEERLLSCCLQWVLHYGAIPQLACSWCWLQVHVGQCGAAQGCRQGHRKTCTKERQGGPGSLQLGCFWGLWELLLRGARCQSGHHKGQSTVRRRSTSGTQHMAAVGWQREAGQSVALFWHWCCSRAWQAVSRACLRLGGAFLGALGWRRPHKCHWLCAFWLSCL